MQTINNRVNKIMAVDRSAYQKQYRQDYKTRTKRVNLTFSQAEYKVFQRAADKHNSKQAVTTYIKQLALDGLKQQASIPDDLRDELSTLRFAIRNIANNVNQLARHSNTVKNMTTSEENNLLLHIQQLEQAVDEYTQGRLKGGESGSKSGNSKSNSGP